MKRTAIIGLGVTGLSCLRYLHGGADIVVLDTRENPPTATLARREYPDADLRLGVKQFDFQGVDRVIVSPGVDPDSCLLRSAHAAGVEFESDIDLFCEAANAPIIAITGTNGKSTVTSLVGHILASAGRSAGVGGNLGEAALDLLDSGRDSYVIELSSFQLERLRPHRFQTASMLNVSEDHIDRHGSLLAYAASKQRIYRDCQRAVANRMDSLTRPACDVPRVVTFGIDEPDEGDWGVVDGYLSDGASKLLPAADLPIAGRHNTLNMLAAFALASGAGIADDVLVGAALGFRGLPHRCEHVADVKGVRYVNDSKATNVGATVAALIGLGDASRRDLVLIAGGDGKGADFTPLRQSVQLLVKHLIVLGADAQAIETAVGDLVAVTHVPTLQDAVRVASDEASKGDLVLLSPACASLDMFTGFAQRGECFTHAVQELIA